MKGGLKRMTEKKRLLQIPLSVRDMALIDEAIDYISGTKTAWCRATILKEIRKLLKEVRE